MYHSFDIFTGCTDVSSIYVDTIDLLGSSRVVFKPAFAVIFSEILFPNRSPATSAICRFCSSLKCISC